MKNINSKSLKRSRNRGSVERESKLSEHDGDVMTLVKKDVISVPPTKSIKDTAKIMIEHEFRRIPVTDPGSGKLLGIVTSMDILNFLGGGDKYNIINVPKNLNFIEFLYTNVMIIISLQLMNLLKRL